MLNTQWKVFLFGISMFLVNLTSANAEEGRATTVSSNHAQPVVGASKQDSGPELQGKLNRPQLQTRNPRYRLGKSDSIELNFPFAPAFNQTLTVQPDGFITLRGLGDVRVEGKTIPELTEMLRAGYSKILQEPIFTVGLKDFEKPYFIASGQFGHPGKFELRGPTTVAQGIAVAGGFNEKAKHSQVLLFRRVSDDWVEVKELNMKKMLQEANLREDFFLQPGDMLFVPQNLLSKVKSFIPAARMSLSPSDF